MAENGRPTRYSKKIADEICQRLAEQESLRSICSEERMPSKSTVLRWLREDKHLGFRNQYAYARELQADGIEDEILDIADDGSNDWMERELDNGKIIEVVNHEYINRSRLRVDARFKYLGQVRPKKWGKSAEPDKEVKTRRYVIEPRKTPKSDRGSNG